VYRDEPVQMVIERITQRDAALLQHGAGMRGGGRIVPEADEVAPRALHSQGHAATGQAP
jgi:hypothetical protein